jgi:hypothetical protein
MKSNGVSVIVIEDSIEVIESERTGQVAEPWKTSANTKKCEEFRSINILSNLEKILEIVVKVQLDSWWNILTKTTY